MPRRLLLLLLPALLLARRATAQTNPVSTRPVLTYVIVYLNGTALEHWGDVTLAAGLNRVVVNGLSPLFNEENMEMVLGERAALQSVGGDDYNDDDDSPEPTARLPAIQLETARLTARLQTPKESAAALQAGASQKVRFSFEVDYPKNKSVDIVNRVQISKNLKFR